MVDVEESHTYSTFRGTYRIISFTMSVGMIYPDPKTQTRRLIGVLFFLMSSAPLSAMMLIDIYDSFLRRDMFNIIRHSTIVGPFLGGLTKMFIMLYKTETAKAIMDEIDEDYAKYNRLPGPYKDVINVRIADNVFYSEKCWVLTVVIVAMVFPGMAVAMSIHNTIFTGDHRVMIHDLPIPNTKPETKYETPVYEMMFVYMLYFCIVFIITFVGLDAFFGLSVNHACLKMELYCKALGDALRETSEERMTRGVVDVIKQQNRTARYTDLIQDTFNIWLGLILVATMIQIGTCTFNLIEGGDVDLRHMVFMIGIVIHIYLPCKYSAKLKDMSLETARLIYGSGWEGAPYSSIRKQIHFMIARGQVPVEITAFNIFIFDMDLFVRIMKSSYSMYTLLRS